MKKHIIKSISILSLLVLLSGSAVSIYAGGGTCSVPSCHPKMNIAAPATTPAVTKPSEPDLYEQELILTEQSEDLFGFSYFLAQWALNFLR